MVDAITIPLFNFAKKSIAVIANVLLQVSFRIDYISIGHNAEVVILHHIQLRCPICSRMG